MGMYDIVYGIFYCPFCGNRLEEFQTKVFDECCLDEMSLEDFTSRLQEIANQTQKYIVGEMHDICKNCDHLVSINIAVSPYSK